MCHSIFWQLIQSRRHTVTKCPPWRWMTWGWRVTAPGELWLVDPRSRDHSAHLWLVPSLTIGDSVKIVVSGQSPTRVKVSRASSPLDHADGDPDTIMWSTSVQLRSIFIIFQPKLLISVKWRKILKSQRHLGRGKWEVWERSAFFKSL